MTKNRFLYLGLVGLLLLQQNFSYANRVATPDAPIHHCYHWLDERTQKFLTYKYTYEKAHPGELTFYTTGGNGAVAGPGLYCAKTPIGSYGYGDRVIRIEFVDDVVLNNMNTGHVCGKDGNFYKDPAECARKSADVYLYSTSNDWYVIQNPASIMFWTTNDDTLVADLNAIKADADSTAQAHIDVTLGLIANEVRTMGKKTFQNTNARMNLLEILKDQNKVNAVPVLALLNMISTFPVAQLPEAKKIELYNKHVERAIKDTLLAYTDFENVIKDSKELEKVFLSKIQAVNYADLGSYNTSVLISTIEKKGLSITAENAVKLWQAAMKSSSALGDLLSLGIKKDSVFRKQFNAALPAVESLTGSLKSTNISGMLNILNEFADPSSNLKAYTKALFKDLLKSDGERFALETYKKLTNASLVKENAIAELIIEEKRNQFQKMEPISLGLLLDEVAKNVDEQTRTDLQKEILKLPMKVSAHLSYLTLEEYKNGKLNLPSFMGQDTFFLKLLDRSIKERGIGQNTTNTYRMVLSGFYHYFEKKIYNARTKDKDKDKDKDALTLGAAAPGSTASLRSTRNANRFAVKNDKDADPDAKPEERFNSEQKTIRKEASEAFLMMARYLYAKGSFAYAYAALQNSVAYSLRGNYEQHPLEKVLLGDMDDTTMAMVKASMDTSVMLYLTAMITPQKDHTPSSKAKDVLEKILTHLMSPQMSSYLSTEDFKVSNLERKTWANVVFNKAFSSNGRISADICSFNKALMAQKPVLSVAYTDLWPKLEGFIDVANKSYCAPPAKP